MVRLNPACACLDNLSTSVNTTILRVQTVSYFINNCKKIFDFNDYSIIHSNYIVIGD